MRKLSTFFLRRAPKRTKMGRDMPMLYASKGKLGALNTPVTFIFALEGVLVVIFLLMSDCF